MSVCSILQETVDAEIDRSYVGFAKLFIGERGGFLARQPAKQIKHVVWEALGLLTGDMLVERCSEEHSPNVRYVVYRHFGDLVAAPANAPVVIDIREWGSENRELWIESLVGECPQVVSRTPAHKQSR